MHSSKPSQPIQPSHVGNAWQASQTSHSRKPSRYGYTSHTSLPRQSGQSKPPSRYSYPIHPNKSNLSRVRGGPTIKLTSNKPIRRAPRYPISYRIGGYPIFRIR